MQVFSHINGLCLWECTVYSESGFAASKGLLLNLDEVLPTQELRCKSIFICNWCPTLKEYRSCRAVMSCGGICFCAVKIWVMVGESRKILTVSICTDFVGYYYYKAKLFIVFPFSVLSSMGCRSFVLWHIFFLLVVLVNWNCLWNNFYEKSLYEKHWRAESWF